MPSPFPGMDPFLEGYLYSDLHQRLANQISTQLAPRLSPRYVTRLAVSVLEDETGEAEIGVMYPDVEIIEPTPKKRIRAVKEAAMTLVGVESLVLTPAVVFPVNLKYRQVTVEVRDTGKNELVTSIEILSPVNKREPGLSHYRDKRRWLYDAGVHLFEIDLLRRGTRILSHPQLANVPYAAALTRAHAQRGEGWPIRLHDKLPVVPVPLRPPDPQVPLDLQAAFTTIYDIARYDLTIDYTEKAAAPDAFFQDAAWMRELLGQQVR